MFDLEAVRSALLERRRLLVTTKLTASNANLPELQEQVDSALAAFQLVRTERAKFASSRLKLIGSALTP